MKVTINAISRVHPFNTKTITIETNTVKEYGTYGDDFYCDHSSIRFKDGHIVTTTHSLLELEKILTPIHPDWYDEPMGFITGD